MEEIQSKEHLEQILAEHSYVILDIYTDWCQPCKYLTPILEDMSMKLEYMKFVKMNGELDLIDVNGFPSVLYFKNGALVSTTLGADTNEIMTSLHQISGQTPMREYPIPWKRQGLSGYVQSFMPQSSAVRTTRKM